MTYVCEVKADGSVAYTQRISDETLQEVEKTQRTYRHEARDMARELIELRAERDAKRKADEFEKRFLVALVVTNCYLNSDPRFRTWMITRQHATSLTDFNEFYTNCLRLCGYESHDDAVQDLL